MLSKPFFDRDGLIVATEDERPVGFVHAGFGPNEAGTALDPAHGATCMLMVAHHPQRAAIADRASAAQRGVSRCARARWLYGGGMACVAPFYMGLYGGCDVPGIVESDQHMIQLYRAAGYVELSRRVDSAAFPGRIPTGRGSAADPVSPRLRRRAAGRLRRRGPGGKPAWQARPTGSPTCFDRATADRSWARAVFWNMEPLASSWGVQRAG